LLPGSAAVFGSEQRALVAGDEADLVGHHHHPVQVFTRVRALRAPVLSVIVGMEDGAARAHDPSAFALKAQMKELRVSAGGLLAPGHSAIGGPEDQPIVSNDVTVIFIHELDRIEIDGSITLSAPAGAIQILHKGAAPVLAEQHRSGVADDPHTASEHED